MIYFEDEIEDTEDVEVDEFNLSTSNSNEVIQDLFIMDMIGIL